MTKQTSNTAERKHGHIWLLILFALVMLLMAAAISFGAQVYSRALQVQTSSAQIRSVEGYLASTFKANDEDNTVTVDQAPEGKMLRVVDENGLFETCIYLYKGKLVQEYKSVDVDLAPEAANVIAQISRFEPSIDGNTITVSTDAGTFVSTLRSGGER